MAGPAVFDRGGRRITAVNERSDGRAYDGRRTGARSDTMADNPGRVLRQESQAVGELAALHRARVLSGPGLARGDGRIVVGVPGLFGNDLYLQPLRQWLSRIGYRPVMSRLAV